MKKFRDEEKDGLKLLDSAESLIVHYTSLPLFKYYFLMANKSQSKESLSATVGTSAGGCYSLALFPKILNDAEALYAFQKAWSLEQSKVTVRVATGAY